MLFLEPAFLRPGGGFVGFENSLDFKVDLQFLDGGGILQSRDLFFLTFSSKEVCHGR